MLVKIFLIILTIILAYLAIKILVKHFPSVVRKDNLNAIEKGLRKVSLHSPNKKGITAKLAITGVSLLSVEIIKREKAKKFNLKISELESIINSIEEKRGIRYLISPLENLKEKIAFWQGLIIRGDYDDLSLKTDLDTNYQSLLNMRDIFLEIEDLFDKNYKTLKLVKKNIKNNELKNSISELELALSNYQNSNITFSDLNTFLEIKNNLSKILIFLEQSLQSSRETSEDVDNYYKILGVDRNSSLDEIKRAYRKAVLNCHPDRKKGQIDRLDDEDIKSNVQDIYKNRFQKIQQAYEILSDSEKRKTYDSSME